MKQTIRTLMPFIQQYITFLYLKSQDDGIYFVAEEPKDQTSVDYANWLKYTEMGPRVIWTPTPGVLPSRPDLPYIALNVAEQREEAQEGIYASNGLSTVKTPTRATLTVEMFGDSTHDPVDILEDIRRRVTMTSWLDVAFKNGIAFFDSAPVLDIAALLDGVSWEPRARLEFSIRYTAVMTEAVSTIEKATIDGTYLLGALEKEQCVIEIDSTKTLLKGGFKLGG